MNANKKYYPVLWENGMKLNKEVFQQQQHANTYQAILNLKAQTHALAYGLFAPLENYEVHLSYDNQQTLHLRIPKLLATTPAGYMIDIDESFDQSLGLQPANFQLLIPHGKEDGDYWVVLLVHPYDTKGVAFDAASGANSFARAQYELQLLSQSALSAQQLLPNGLVLGELSLRSNQVSVNEDFIPAVMRANAHPDVYQWYVSLLKVLENIDYRSIQIIQKIVQKNQQNDLSKIVHKLCESVSNTLNVQLSKCSISNGNIAPVELMMVLSSIARSVKNAIDMNIGSGKEELMNYLSEWVNITPGAFEETLSRVANVQYDAIDTNRNIAAVNYFITTINHLFETLQKLDFIGKKKDSGLFIKEETNNYTEQATPAANNDAPKPKRKFFGY